MNQPLALVTGATGWLGHRLVKALVKGLPDDDRFQPDEARRVRCLVLPKTDVSVLEQVGNQIEFVAGDIRQKDSLKAFFMQAEGATVFHCAGMIHPPGRVRAFYDINVAGTRHVLLAAQEAGAKRLVHVSSNSPIGTNPATTHVFDEESPYAPYMHYGLSKMQAEHLVREVSSDLETVVIRPPWFYGPGQPARQTRFFQMIRDGKVPIVGSGENRRSMAYVDNICQGLLLCERVNRASGQVYWIADAQSYSMNEIVETVARVLECDFEMSVIRRRVQLPDFAGNLAYCADKLLQSIGFYHQKIHVLSEMNKTIACSVDKARKELGYDPKVHLGEGMRRSVEDLLERTDGF